MPHAVSLWFDPATETAVRALWRALHDEGVSSTFHLGRYRPHLTLAVSGGLRLPAFCDTLDAFAEARAPLEIGFAGLGLFRAKGWAVFLLPTPTAELLELHRDLATLAANHGTLAHDYYLPDRWNPHCTLAAELSRAKTQRALELLALLEPPGGARATRIGVVDTAEERELYASTLSGGAS